MNAKQNIWSTLQLFLRLPEVPPYRLGRISQTTGKQNYSRRLRTREAWAEEIRLAEQAARYTAKPRFVTRAEKMGWR